MAEKICIEGKLKWHLSNGVYYPYVEADGWDYMILPEINKLWGKNIDKIRITIETL
jgi:hypothetical protein